METNGNQRTWLTYEEARNDFSPKSSVDEFVKPKEIYRDSANAIRSQADIFLTEIEKQLEVTESKYESAMQRLRYTKMLYGNAAGSMSLETNDYDRTEDSTINQKNSQSDASSCAPALVDDKNFENNLSTSGTTQYLQEIQNTQNNAPAEESDTKNPSTEQTSKSFEIASNSNSSEHIDAEDRNNDKNDQSYSFERTKGSEINFQFMSKETLENRGIDNVNQIREEHFLNDISTRRVHPYQLHLAEYSKGLHEQFEEESRNAESPTLDSHHEIYTSDLNPSLQQEPRNPEKHVNPAGSIQSFQTSKKTKRIRHDKHQRKTLSSKIVSKSIDDSIGQTTKKKKHKKRGLKTSNSRCTTATKETTISENKKESKLRPKQKGYSTVSNLQLSQNRRHQNVITKNQTNMSDVVELYHNRVLRSDSLSVVSSKHSKVMETRIRAFNNGNKFDQPWRTKGSHRLVENKEKRVFDDIAEQRSKKQETNELNQRKNENFGNEDESCRDHLQETVDFRSGEPNRINYEADCPINQSENNTIKEYRDDVNQEIGQDSQLPHNLPPSFDFFSTRNYASPTQSSRMKQVHRSYFNRFNFRNIPFVVGTSVTPSYNLGLNIQEALSLMKTRQLMPSRISPLLISNVSKGLKPVSALFECIRGERVPLMEERNVPLTINSRGMTSLYQQGSMNEEKTSRPMQMTPFSLKSAPFNFIPDTETLYEAQESDPKFEMTPKKQKTQSICSSMRFNNQKSVEPKLEMTQSFLLRQRQEELNMSESAMGKWQNETHGSKGIREVLMNFSDQYESMIKKFEKLQEQSKKSNDKSLEKEIAALEKELNSKEEEIKAVASLYQEVMILKRQMRMLYERNSLVCVSTTEAPGNPTYPHFSMRAQTANPIRMINVYRRGGFVNNQGPPTSTKLAGMLRQIKTFQKHLKSDT